MNNIELVTLEVGDILLTHKGNKITRWVKQVFKVKEDYASVCIGDGIVLLSNKEYAVYRPKKNYSKKEKILFSQIIVKSKDMNIVESIFSAINSVRNDTLNTNFRLVDIKSNKYYKKIF